MNVSDLIDGLGGVVALARACGVTAQAVSNWKAEAQVPARHTILVWTMAKRAGLPWRPPGCDGLDLVLPDEPEAHARDDGSAFMFPQCSCEGPAPAGKEAV